MFLCMFVCTFVKKMNDKIKKNKNDETSLSGKVYQIIYENNCITINDISRYLEIEVDEVESLLKDLVDKNILSIDQNGVYVIKKNQTD